MAAVVTFGVTASLLADKFFATGVSERFSDVAAQVIEEVASDLEAHLHATNVEAVDVTEAHSPRSFRWLQTTILYGAAAETARRNAAVDADTLDQWDTKFTDRMRELRTNANTVLGDLTSRRQRTRTLHTFR